MTDPKLYLIYKITNLVNGKIYVGKHVATKLDDGYFGSGFRLQQALRKYGESNFVREILLICKDRNQMNLAERILVVVDPDVTYNLVPGGGGGMMRPHTEAAKAKVSAANKGRKHSPEARARMGASHIGFKHSEESKQKMRGPKKSYVFTEAGLAKRRENNKTRIVSLETRIKMGNTRRGKPLPAGTSEKIAEKNKGRKVSDESRAKMSKSGLANWAIKKAKIKEFFPEGER